MELIEQVGDRVLGFRDKGKWFGEVLSIRGAIHPGPNFRSVGGDLPVGFAEEGIDAWVAKMTGIGDEDVRLYFQGLGEVSGRAIVPVAKAC